MKRIFQCLTLVAGFVAAGLLLAQEYAPPPSQKPDDAKRREITIKTDRLRQRVEALRRKNVRDAQLVEVEIYLKAAEWILRFDEFYHKDAADWTLQILDDGLLRSSQAAQGEFPWLQEAGHPIVRAYRSVVDGSIQPYAVTYPVAYGKDPGKKWRVDVVLHGRDSGLTEVKFLRQHAVAKAAPADQDFVQIDIFGRCNNAYRWAGATDVAEVQQNFAAVERLLGRGQLLDPARVVLRGFSMGGAGTWHIGLHEPDRWCVLGPGAGFTTTHGYIRGLPDKLPSYLEDCLRIYDAVDYAENVFDAPVVAYGGSNDPQLRAAQNIEAKLKPLGIPMTLLVAPGLAHQFPPEWQKKAEEQYAKYAAKGRDEYPRRVHFVTYTLKYPRCDWVTILGLDRHYERTLVDATNGEDGFTVQTSNVRTLSLDLPKGSLLEPLKLTVDGQKLEAKPYLNLALNTMHIYLQHREGHWSAVLPEKILTDATRRLQKLSGLQGPIDDAFTAPFLCVTGSREAWHAATQRYAEENLKRFQHEWAKYLRGELPVKKDTEVTPEDLAGKHLILFGDPASNSLIAQALDGLPLKWTNELVVLGGTPYSAASHVPALIYPSPFSARHYVVLNSGHTFHAADFEGTNALLYPRLGDYAVLRLAPTEKDPLAAQVERAGLFDDFWQMTR